MSDRSLPRIAALLRQAEGTDNAHEAEAFLQAAQRLATASSIDLAVARQYSEAERARTTPVQRAVSIGTPGTRGLRTYVELFLAISRANDVTCDIASNSSRVYCFGFESDIATCEALYASLAVQMVRASDRYIKSGAFRAGTAGRWESVRDEWGSRQVWLDKPVHASTARINFQHAFARRIGARLADARQEARTELLETDRAARPVNDTAPGTAVAIRNKEIELRDFHRENSKARGRWKGARAQAGECGHARAAGDRAARSAQLAGRRELGGQQHAIATGGIEL